MPTPAEVANFQNLLRRLADAANAVIARIWDGNPHTYARAVDPYLAGSAQLSTQWYHSLKPEAPFVAEPGPLPPAEALHANAFHALSMDDPITALAGTTERHIFQTSADTVKFNADREHVRYARYASATACAFCQILATKNTLYSSKQAARFVVGRHGRARGTRKIGDKYHDGCKCLAVPVRPGDSYTPPDYVEQWNRDYQNASADETGLDNIVNHMRRTQYARAKDAGVFGSLSQTSDADIFGSLTATP